MEIFGSDSVLIELCWVEFGTELNLSYPPVMAVLGLGFETDETRAGGVLSSEWHWFSHLSSCDLRFAICDATEGSCEREKNPKPPRWGACVLFTSGQTMTRSKSKRSLSSGLHNSTTSPPSHKLSVLCRLAFYLFFSNFFYIYLHGSVIKEGYQFLPPTNWFFIRQLNAAAAAVEGI